MILLKTISVFMHKKAHYEVDAVQGETGRGIELRLYDEDGVWVPAPRTQVVARFKKNDGTGGVYDTLPDGTLAWRIQENVISLALAPQVLSVPGEVQMQVVLVCGEEELSTFLIHIHVEEDLSKGVLESENYVNLTTQINNTVIQRLREAERTWQTLFDEITITMFSEGALSISTGQEVASDTEIRSDMIAMGSRAISVVFPEEVWVQCFYYDENEQFIGYSQMFSEPFTTQTDAANVRLVACYADEREITDLYELSDSIAVSFPSDRTDNYRGEVTELGFASFGECLEDGCYSFRDPSGISDAPEISCGGMLSVQSRGGQPVMQTLLTDMGECWFRVGDVPFRRIPELTAQDVGAMPEKIELSQESPLEPDSLTSGQVAWDTNLSNGLEHIEGQCAVYSVAGLKRVTVRGYQWQAQYNYYGYVLYDENGTAISKHLGGEDNSPFEIALDVPENVAKIRINGHTSYPMGVFAPNKVSAQEVVERVAVEQAKKPKLLLLGDSITQLGTSDRGWVKYFLEATGCEQIANTAVSGAVLNDKTGTVYDGNPVFNGLDGNANNVLGNQVQKVIQNGYEAPDLIMIAIGTNGGIQITQEDIYSAYYDTDGTKIALSQVNRTTAAGAYRYCLETLHNLYPNAVICWCTPIMAHHQLRNPAQVRSWAESLRIATEFTGQILIDTIRCGISGINESTTASGDYLLDGLHPNENGARKIGYYNASKVLPYIRSGFVKG